jgi:hypothetical protein
LNLPEQIIIKPAKIELPQAQLSISTEDAHILETYPRRVWIARALFKPVHKTHVPVVRSASPSAVVQTFPRQQ